MPNESLVIEGLTYSYGKDLPPALSELSATIRPGIVTGLVGPDGAGKTTLMRLMTALLLPSSGHLTVFGLDTRSNASQLHEIIGYMPQKFGLYEDLSVIQNLRLYADLRNVTTVDRKQVFARLLDFTGLEPFQKRLAGRLSGGMKQKLGLACALIRKPRLLLLDEPSVGVDPVSRRELWRMVQELVDEETAVIWSTAYLDEAELCQDVLLLDNGQLMFSGPPKDLTERVAGRCFQIQGISNNRRQVLSTALQQDEVQDGIVQGQNVRMVLRAGHNQPALSVLDAGVEARLTPVAPRFEDAYIDALGGGPGGISALATAMTPLPDDQEVTVEADGLTKRFGNFTAAENVSFAIRRGEIFGLLGPNGAGKSTTFKMMCGLLRPSSGTGRVVGLDLQKAPGKARSRLGYMAQKFSLYGDLSARQNLVFFSGVYGLTGMQQKETVTRMIDIFGLQPHLTDSAKDLPLGFKQRLALACSVMHEPAVLFLDEPTSGVDPLTRREFWTHINGLVEHGVTVLVTTHFMDEAEYCDRIGLIYRGQMIATGPPDELKSRTRSPQMPDPTLEEAFISLLQQWDASHEEKA
ncbi:MAG: ATP-binding cassette domain-containing protein [Proteobacteria bacterium]|nr:ABC transporter ATP-binding protein [Desulfocapsa sp.]MBU3943117.1 ATP-binding cassette domain-containing protein [Pseudomonadota bacterium]MCG2745695.1 ATP-binding cassette domain-containing protein [Desulfobacteraceae bacterium]MBU3983875.1 ATP-binding cassette domain-containing protein [Pseudomonadota bacterium]MBU4041560.1 ATP-binding cassette domain-containing protein [Pseudomonadota bacterium]